MNMEGGTIGVPGSEGPYLVRYRDGEPSLKSIDLKK
jgi:hypothetical protein